MVGIKLRYLGPKGAVEAPISELIDGAGGTIRPRSLVWQGGPRELARWLPTGGLAKVQFEYVGAMQLKFDLPAAAAGLKFAFGDIEAFPLTRTGAQRACGSLLKPGELQLPRALPRPVPKEKPDLRVFREAYPCLTPQRALRTVEANQPPQHPLHVLLFGRDFLPNVRQVDLPTGNVPAKSYSYTGADALVPLEEEASRMMAADYGDYLPGLVTAPVSASKARKYFAFNWGVQKSRSGGALYPIAIYEVKACAAR
jgi:hypothetical protein